MLLPPTHLPSRPASRKRKVVATIDDSAVDEGLFEALRKHRMQLAREQGVPPYVVAGDRTLREIAATRPSSLDELGVLYGIGPAKLEKYGPGLLEVVAQTPPGA